MKIEFLQFLDRHIPCITELYENLLCANIPPKCAPEKIEEAEAQLMGSLIFFANCILKEAAIPREERISKLLHEYTEKAEDVDNIERMDQVILNGTFFGLDKIINAWHHHFMAEDMEKGYLHKNTDIPEVSRALQAKKDEIQKHKKKVLWPKSEN
jgi:hypothetical protein